MIRITGDVHGQLAPFERLDREYLWKPGDMLIICGDFCLKRDRAAENAFLDALAERPYLILFVDGNHEDFPALNALPVEEWHGGKVHRLRPNVLHLMRGQIFTLCGRTFFTMGGAYSIDRAVRVKGQSWWDEEIPSDAELDEAGANLLACGKRVDYVLTHQMPAELIRWKMHAVPDPHEQSLIGFLDYVLFDIQFEHWYCGHWHEDIPLLPGRVDLLLNDVKELDLH